MRAARRTVFVGVHAKFGAVSFCRFAEIGALEAIVTSTLLPASEAHRYSLLGPQVVRV
ncbi:DeoR-family transcriptional regulator OS=Streptomyces glaucescens OX=1907 GN=SGLAU_08505 PE=4 SV=1 [Streptomyces glaucescens]